MGIKISVLALDDTRVYAVWCYVEGVLGQILDTPVLGILHVKYKYSIQMLGTELGGEKSISYYNTGKFVLENLAHSGSYFPL